MKISPEVEKQVKLNCPKGHGPAELPIEGKWVQVKDISQISGLSHGVGRCAPQQGCCKLTLNVKDGVIVEALVETTGCTGATHGAAVAGEHLVGKTLLEALNTHLACDAINVAMREIFMQMVYGRSQTAFTDDGLPVGATLEDLGKGLISANGAVFSTLEKGPRLLQMAEGYVLDMAVNDQWRKLSEQAINEELADQPLFTMLRQDHPLASAPVVALEALKDWMCILVTPEEQRENEVVHWRDYFGLQSDFLFVENVETACMDAASGAGFYLCDGDMPCPDGTVLLPVTRGGAPMTRKMFAFWPESRDSSLQWEFTQALHTVIK